MEQSIVVNLMDVVEELISGKMSNLQVKGFDGVGREEDGDEERRKLRRGFNSFSDWSVRGTANHISSSPNGKGWAGAGRLGRSLVGLVL